MRQMLPEWRGHVKIYGGGVGLIVPAKSRAARCRITALKPGGRSPPGLQGLTQVLLAATTTYRPRREGHGSFLRSRRPHGDRSQAKRQRLPVSSRGHRRPVVGLPPQACRKSSLTDELVRRFLYDFLTSGPRLFVDPAAQTVGALLCARIRFTLKNPPCSCAACHPLQRRGNACRLPSADVLKRAQVRPRFVETAVSPGHSESSRSPTCS